MEGPHCVVAHPSRHMVAAVSGLCFLLACAQGAAAAPLVAEHPDDICAADANPCVIDFPVQVAAGVGSLDFGTRQLEIRSKGQLDLRASGPALVCGDLVVDYHQSIPAFLLSQSLEGERFGGYLNVHAVKGCSGGDAHCEADSDCNLGPCGTRRCSKNVRRECGADDDCHSGTCMANKRCSLKPTIRCLSDVDCDSGVCPLATTCDRLASSPTSPDGRRECDSDADCDFGACTVGTGSIDIDTPISGEGDDGGDVTLRATGDIVVRRRIDVSGTAADSGGGAIGLFSKGGKVVVEGDLVVIGDYGGQIDLEAAGGIVTRGDLDVRGGEYGGGSIDLRSDGDIVLARRLLASAMTAGGLGGMIDVRAKGDLLIDATDYGPTAQFAVHGADTPAGGEFDSGDGGELYLDTEGDLRVDGFSRISARGGAPYGWGGYVDLFATGDLSFSGDIEAGGGGSQTGGGGVRFAAIRGGLVYATGSSIDVSGGGKGEAGFVTLDGAEEAFIGGSIVALGGEGKSYSAKTQISSCALRIGADADLRITSPYGDNILDAGDSLVIDAGAKLFSKLGANILRYRDASNPLSVAGSFNPAPGYVLDPSLPTCGCGDGRPDDGEACDEGPDPFVMGSACRGDCSWAGCGHPTGSGGPRPSSADALFTLSAAVGAKHCDVRVCDADGDGRVSGADALGILRAAVGLAAPLDCPA